MKVGIIGGGIAGLAAGYQLARAGCPVALFEREAELGGQAGTVPVGGKPVERFYHHLFTSDQLAMEIIQELGLNDRLRWLPSKVGFFYGGKVYPFVTPLDLLFFSRLGLVDRLRLGLLGLYLQRFRNWQSLEGITAQEWILKHGGRRIYDVVWGPLLRSKFGERAAEVGMVWFWGKIHLRFASRGKGAWRERLGYLDGSFGLLTDALARNITEMGGKIWTRTPVENIIFEGGKARGIVAAGQRHELDVIIATVPSPIFLRLVPGLAEDYAQRLRSIQYQGALCLLMTLRRSFSPIYWLTISDRTIPFVLVVQHTNLIEKEQYGGKEILYVSKYLSPMDPLYGASMEEVMASYLPHLRKINPSFGLDWVEEAHIFREDAAQPVITPNYSQRMPELRTPIQGLYLANTTQIYPEDRGINYSLRLGMQVSEAVLASRGSPAPL